jgi:hypothetical protein
VLKHPGGGDNLQTGGRDGFSRANLIVLGTLGQLHAHGRRRADRGARRRGAVGGTRPLARPGLPTGCRVSA